jgi:hypothetical protein
MSGHEFQNTSITVSQGYNTFAFNRFGLRNEVYMVRVISDAGIQTRKLVIE